MVRTPLLMVRLPIRREQELTRTVPIAVPEIVVPTETVQSSNETAGCFLEPLTLAEITSLLQTSFSPVPETRTFSFVTSKTSVITG